MDWNGYTHEECEKHLEVLCQNRTNTKNLKPRKNLLPQNAKD